MSPRVRVIDGGLSLQLGRYVGEVDGNPLWISKFIALNPEEIVKTHLDFLRAGSEIIQTFTYQSSISGFMKHQNASEDEAKGLLRKAGLLALEAKNIYMKENPDAVIEINGSLGPYGALLLDGSEYTGAYADKLTPEMVKEIHRPRINELYKVGVRLFAFETIPCKKEGLAVTELLKEYPDIKCWISFSIKDDKSLSSGDDFKSTVIECYERNPQQIVAVGANCVNPAFVNNLFSKVNEGRDKNNLIPLIVYPNSGEKYEPEKGWVPGDDMKPLDSYVKGWIDLGVRIVGGCCRTSAEDIALIKKEVNRVSNIKA